MIADVACGLPCLESDERRCQGCTVEYEAPEPDDEPERLTMMLVGDELQPFDPRSAR